MRRTILSITVLSIALALSAAPLSASPRYSPDKAVQLRIGGFLPNGDSDFWRSSEETFTLDESDFDDVAVGLSLVYPVNRDLEVGLNVDFYDSTFASEYRDFVDENGFPIVHDTRLGIVPITFDVRWLAGGRHRGKPVFYLGGGAGIALWEYEEFGDFLDFSADPATVFFDRFKNSGSTFETHLMGGVELPLAPRTNLLMEARYSFADDDLDGDFAGLGRLDLGGVHAYAGLSFRF